MCVCLFVYVCLSKQKFIVGPYENILKQGNFLIQSTLNISKSKLISNYCLIKVNFLVPENLL